MRKCPKCENPAVPFTAKEGTLCVTCKKPAKVAEPKEAKVKKN